MKWRKLGRIFDPTQHKLPNDCVQFAQSPQALVFDDFVRIYFSTRAVDKSNGKYLSHIAFVDMHKNLRDVIRVSDQHGHPARRTRLLRRARHLPDERRAPRRCRSTATPAAGAGGSRCRWIRRSVWRSATTTDSPSSASATGPVLAASLHEPCLVGDGFVKVDRRRVPHVVHLRHRLEEVLGRTRRRIAPTRSVMRVPATASTG